VHIDIHSFQINKKNLWKR